MLKILTIDDNKNNLVVLQAIFSNSFPEAHIITALSGMEGIEKARKESPDVILLDLIMPGMDGIETCKILKEDPLLRQIPVIMITAVKTDSKTRTLALLTGVEAFLSKPIDEAELTAQVTSMIRLKKSENQVRLEKEKLETEVKNRTAELENELAERALVEAELQEALVRAESTNRLKTAFMNNISHELRTPLNGILGFSSLIIQPEYSIDEKALYCSLIKTSSNRLLSTITNYMDISLIASGNMEVNLKLMDFTQMMNQLHDEYQLLCKKKNIVFVMDIPNVPAHLSITSDLELLKKCIAHLLDNAVKFTFQGSITIGYTLNPGSIQIFVKDTGIGISQDSLSMIFESFMQEEICPTKGYGGSGLGLSIAHGIVKLLGGEINVESVKGSGADFFVTIPWSLSSDELINGEPDVCNGKNIDKNVILIVEDDESNRLYLENILNFDSINLLTAGNGKDAVEICRAHPEISLVLMDLKMPVMDGLEATREIRSFAKSLPIIALTAFAMSGDKRRALNAGCDEYLTKPISRDILLGKLKKFGVVPFQK